MSAQDPGRWLGRLSASLREHEAKRSSLHNLPLRYEVLEELSRGGMGIVYRAWDPQLGREVALKVLRPDEGASAEVHERFAREARLAASLHHPHIVPVYDTGTWNGQDYIAMQLVQGTTLERAKPDRRTALTAVRDAARGLHYAHEQGVVHRDVKPSNLLLDPAGRVFVTDFGVARKIEVSSALTIPGTVVGTPVYMSPEQARGEEADARSDVYSLGATLYELMTGRPPYQGQSPGEVLEAVRSRDPLAPRKLAPDLSRNIDAIIQTAMDRERGERYPSALALAEDIDLYLANQRPKCRPRGAVYRFRRAFARYPWRSSAAILLAALVLGSVVLGGLWMRASHFFDLAERERDLTKKETYYGIASGLIPAARPKYEAYRDYRSALRASDSSARKNLLRSAEAQVPEARAAYEEILRKERTDAVTDAVTIGLKETEKVKTEADKKSEEYDKLVDAAAEVRRRIDAKDWKGARNVMETALRTPKGKKFYDDLEGPLRKLERETQLEDLDAAAASGDCEKFDRAYREARALRESSQPEVRRRLSEAILRLARKLLGDRRLKEAVRWLDEYEELAEKVDASILESRSLALAQFGDFERAGKEFDRLRAHLGQGKAPSPALAVIPYERAKKAADRQDWTEALRELTLATQVDPTHARAYHDRGLVRYRAERLAREAISEDLAKAFELDSALRPDALYQDAALSFTRRQVEEYAKAESPAEREAAWREAARLLGIVIARLDSAELRLRRSQMQLRLAAYRPALDDAALAGESQEAFLVRGQISYAVAISEGRDRRKLQDAAGEFSRAIERNPKAALAYYWRGTCRTVLGDAKGATEDFEAAAGLGVLSPYMNYQLSRIYADLKKFDQALEYATRALGGADSLTEDDFIARHFEDEHLPWSAALRLFKRDAYLARGEARFNRREFADSAADCTAAIDLDRELPASYLWRAYAACKDKRHKDAQKDCREFITKSKVPADREVARQFLEQCLEHSKE